MNTAELVSAMAKEEGITKGQAERALNCMQSSVVDAIHGTHGATSRMARQMMDGVVLVAIELGAAVVRRACAAEESHSSAASGLSCMPPA